MQIFFLLKCLNNWITGLHTRTHKPFYFTQTFSTIPDQLCYSKNLLTTNLFGHTSHIYLCIIYKHANIHFFGLILLHRSIRTHFIFFSSSIVKGKHIKTKRHIENFMYDFFFVFGIFLWFRLHE